MRIEGTETDPRRTPDRTVIEAGNPLPFVTLTPLLRDVLANADHLPDMELMRIAGCLRTLADEVMAVVDRRCGARPAPRLIIDNTRR